MMQCPYLCEDKILCQERILLGDVQPQTALPKKKIKKIYIYITIVRYVQPQTSLPPP